MGRTLFDKVWESHVVRREPDRPDILYIDRHLIHEGTSPQAFAALRAAERRVRRPELTFATMDHIVPTDSDRSLPLADGDAQAQVESLYRSRDEYGFTLFDLHDVDQGIVHVIGPELGLTLPGLTIVCGDSHTSTHGAFGAIAFGIGTSEVEHVLATQTLPQFKPKTFRALFEGTPSRGVGAKDMILAFIGKIGTAGATGHALEYAGSAVRRLTMDERMTICNMSIEAGARLGLIAPDDATFAYLEGRRYAPKDADWDRCVAEWRTQPSDPDATFDKEERIDVATLAPQVTWGTNPGMVIDVTSRVPDPASMADADARKATERALDYMGLKPGTPITEIKLDRVFIGSCTNARVGDLDLAAKLVKGRKVAKGVRALVVPGSQHIKRAAEAKGLHRIFQDAGFEWRDAGCSMCVGMNADILGPGERCASTSNRNFEGRQGKGGRTHLCSPLMAAAAALHGRFVDIRQMDW